MSLKETLFLINKVHMLIGKEDAFRRQERPITSLTPVALASGLLATFSTFVPLLQPQNCLK